MGRRRRRTEKVLFIPGLWKTEEEEEEKERRGGEEGEEAD